MEQIAIANSLDLEIKRREICAVCARMGIDITRIVFPALEIGVSAEREEGVWFVGPAFAVALPFFDFGFAAKASAQAEIFRLWNQYTALAVDIRSAARTFRFQTINSARLSRHYAEVIVPLAEQMTANTLLQHNAMQLGVFELLSIKQQELEKKIQMVKMQRHFWVMETKLEMLLSGHLDA